MRRTSIFVAGVAMVASALVTCAASADEPTPLVECLGTESITYTPGLTTTARDVDLAAQGTVAPCVSVLGPDFAGGQITFDGSGSLSCLAGGNSTGAGTIAWNGGQESEFTYTGGVSLRPLGVTVLVLTGEVTDGAFEGAGMLTTITLASLDLLACLSPQGVTSTGGPITVNINPLT